MRIPRYRSNVQLTREAPGRPMTARMRAGPMVNAIEGKANVFNAAVQQVNEYSLMRQKMINEARRNEAIFGAKEGLLSLADTLEDDKNPFDIFNDDGSGRYQDGVEDIRKTMRSKVTQNDNELAAFDAAFQQAELSIRFQLKDKIDKNIEERHVLSLNQNRAQLVKKYSSVDADFTNFETDFAAELQRVDNAVKAGIITADNLSTYGPQLLQDIGVNLVPNFVQRDLTKALELSEAFYTAPDELGATNVPENLLNVLREMPAQDAEKIISNALTQSLAVVNAKQQIQKAEEEKQEYIIESVTNRFQYYSNKQGNEPITPEQLSETDRLVPGLQDFIAKGGTMTAIQVQEQIKQFLYDENAVDATLQKVFDDAAVVVTTPYAGETIPGTYDILYNEAIFGELDQRDLEESKPFLSKEDYGKLATIIDNKRAEKIRASNKSQTDDEKRANAAFTAALNSAKGSYSYDELTADDEDLGDLKRAAFFAVSEGLNSFKLKSLVDGTEFSPATINAELQRLLAENEQVFKLEALDNYEAYLQSTRVKKYPNLKLTTVDPFKTLDEWYASQDTDLGTPGVQVEIGLTKEYGRILERLKEFNKFGIFQ